MERALQQTFIPQTLAQLVGTIEAVLFVSAEPAPMKQLVELTGWEHDQVLAALELLEQNLARDDRGLRLLHVAGGVQLATKPQLQSVLEKLTGPRPPAPLSRAALETLAIIAYRQPVTRAEVDRLRGVRSQAAIYSLQDRELVEEAARAELPGRPILYRTTERFLHWCGIESLSQLPPLPAVEESSAGITEAAAAHESEDRGDFIDPPRASGDDESGAADAPRDA